MLFGHRNREATAVSQEIVAQRIMVEQSSNNLVKVLDEMLDAANAANSRARNPADVSRPPVKPRH